MPYKTSSESSLEDAQKMIDMLGIESLTIPITEMADVWIEQFPEMSAIRKGNVMARCRMITLYDQSAAFEGLVVGTGNKTEALLGYTTLYGDSACAFNPVGDLYKTQVRQLARSFDIPGSIITKPPSADLWVGQTDEEELGFTYEEVDRLLYLLVEKRLDTEACVERGFDPDFIEKVVGIIRRTAFKRVMPPIATLDPQGAGYGFVNDPGWNG
jgi:NAD+ synthase